MRPKCNETSRSGEPCKNPARKGRDRCAVHGAGHASRELAGTSQVVAPKVRGAKSWMSLNREEMSGWDAKILDRVEAHGRDVESLANPAREVAMMRAVIDTMLVQAGPRCCRWCRYEGRGDIPVTCPTCGRAAEAELGASSRLNFFVKERGKSFYLFSQTSGLNRSLTDFG